MMKDNILQYVLMLILFAILTSLSVWSVFYIDDTENRIAVFGIIAIILAAFTSVLTISINHNKAKAKEFELLVLKEKQKVYEHFYNAMFDLLDRAKTKKGGHSPKAYTEMMLFKKGLMNWGSEKLIKAFIEYDNKLLDGKGNFNILIYGNTFLKEIRKEMRFSDSKKLNLMSIILTAEARKEMLNGK